MAARKTHRGRRNRGRFGFLYVVLSFLLIAAALVAGSVVFFRANTITVEGNDRYTDQEIIAAAQVELKQNLFRINRPHTYQRILDTLPYVRSVNIRRAFPDELVITVTETQAVAFITCSGRHYLLDARGKVLEQVPSPPSSLIRLTGLDPLPPVVGSRLEADAEQQLRLSGAVGVLTALEAHGQLEYVGEMDLSSASSLTFSFTPRFTAKMPLSCDFDYKVRSLIYVVEQLEENETGLIDLTRSDEIHVIPPAS